MAVLMAREAEEEVMTEEPMWKIRHDALSAPFPEGAVKTTQKKGGRYQYVTARTVMNRLDDVVGPGNWSARFEVADPQTGVVKCSLTVYGVTNEDFGDPNNVVKGEYRDGQIFKEASSDALKRAAVFFGVGRYLYEPDYEEEPAGRPSSVIDVRKSAQAGELPTDADKQVARVLALLAEIAKRSDKPAMDVYNVLLHRTGQRMGTDLTGARLEGLAPDALDVLVDETRKALDKASASPAGRN